MKYRAAAILCTLVLTAGALSGCGNDGADTAETENSSQEESVSEEAVSEEEAAAAGFSDGTDEEGNITGETVLDTSKELTGIHHANISIEGYGDIEIELDADTAPITVTNFVKLAQEDFYDGLTFWRIMDGFMMQGGDPLGNGTGGADENIKGEFANNGVENDISHTRGTVSMARASDPDSASSQFFIVQADSTFLDGDYAGFGHVTEGMDIVDQICKDAKPTDNNGTIAAEEQPVIEGITILD